MSKNVSNDQTKKLTMKSAAFFAALVAVGVIARVAFEDLPNVSPVAALALFAGYFFRSRVLAVCVPLSVMLISDQMIQAGGYPWALMLTVYALLASPVLLRSWMKRSVNFENTGIKQFAKSVLMIGGGSLACSLMFYFGTNAMVWATTSLYPQTAAGLATCYAAAIPMFRQTCTGDVSFAFAIFGSYAALKTVWAYVTETTTAATAS